MTLNGTNKVLQMLCEYKVIFCKVKSALPLKKPGDFWRLSFLFLFFHSPCDGLIDTSLWWSDMIDFSCLSSRQVIFIYLPCLPLLLSCSLFLSHLLREFLEIIIFQYRTVSRLHTETRISHITSTAQSCNQNPLTFQNWWVRVMRRVKKHLLHGPIYTAGSRWPELCDEIAF